MKVRGRDERGKKDSDECAWKKRMRLYAVLQKNKNKKMKTVEGLKSFYIYFFWSLMLKVF